MNVRGKALYRDCQRSVEASGTEGLAALRESHLVVAGGTGFVGSWLTTMIAYLNDEYGFRTRVTSISRRAAGFARLVEVLGERSDVQHIACDVRQLVDLPADSTWVVNAAANPDARQHASSPIETAAVIAEGTARVLAVAERVVGLRNVLHLSSGLVAATGQVGPSTPTSIYVAAKHYSEALAAAYRSQARLPVVVSRPFTFFGPFQDMKAPWAANNFVHAALNGLPLKILGNGKSARAYMYGSDMAVLALLQLVGGRNGEVYDLGGREVLTTRELADIVIKQVGRPLEVRINTMSRDDGVSRLVPHLEPSLREFQYEAAFSPSEAIGSTIAWLENNRAWLDRAI